MMSKFHNYVISFQFYNVVKPSFACFKNIDNFLKIIKLISGKFRIVSKIQRLEMSPVFCSVICRYLIIHFFFGIRNSYVKICSYRVFVANITELKAWKTLFLSYKKIFKITASCLEIDLDKCPCRLPIIL